MRRYGSLSVPLVAALLLVIAACGPAATPTPLPTPTPPLAVGEAIALVKNWLLTVPWEHHILLNPRGPTYGDHPIPRYETYRSTCLAFHESLDVKNGLRLAGLDSFTERYVADGTYLVEHTKAFAWVVYPKSGVVNPIKKHPEAPC